MTQLNKIIQNLRKQKKEKKEKKDLDKKEDAKKDLDKKEDNKDDEIVSLSDISSIIDNIESNPIENEEPLSEKDISRIEKGRKYMDEKKKKNSLKEKTKLAKAGKQTQEPLKTNDEIHQCMEIDDGFKLQDTVNESEEDKYAAYEYIKPGYYGKRDGIYNASTDAIE